MTAPLDRLTTDVRAALERLGQALREPKNDIVRDAAIPRFEFSFELFWKALKARAENEGLRVVSPRESLRAAFQLGLLDDDEQVFSRIPAYHALMTAAAAKL